MKILSIVTGLVLFTGTTALAQTRSQVYGDTLTRQTMTASAQADVGLLTYESEAVDSNATSTATSYKVAGYAGEGRELGLIIGVADTITPFALNETRVRSSWQDLALQYRLGYLNPSIIMTTSEIQVTVGDEDFVHVYGQGVGAGLDAQIDLTLEIVVTASAKVVQTPKAHDRQGHDVEFGRRSEIDLNASVDVIDRYVDAIVGYRSRQYSLTVDGVEAQESQSMPYAGLRLGFYF